MTLEAKIRAALTPSMKPITDPEGTAWVEVTLPFLDAQNDQIQVYVRYLEDDNENLVMVTDAAEKYIRTTLERLPGLLTNWIGGGGL